MLTFMRGAILPFVTAAAIVVLAPKVTFAQENDSAKKVYKSSQESVFLVYLNDSDGKTTALGSAFLVAPRTLITNAHVVDAGSPVLAVGPVRIPLTIIRKDTVNDLALLTVSVDLASPILPLASQEPSPGEQVFAIGNPEGLEKTISQGIVSGKRIIDGNALLQITSHIAWLFRGPRPKQRRRGRGGCRRHAERRAKPQFRRTGNLCP
jgi:serine protease Do